MKKKSATRPNYALTRKAPKRIGTDIRQAILDRLKELDKSRNWLATVTGIRVATVYNYLNRRQEVYSDAAAKMLEAVGLEIRPKD